MWNNKAKKNIPQHWTVGVLSDCADITMGQSPDGASYNVDRNGILFFQGATDFGEVFPSERQYTTSPTRYARGGDILLSVRAPVGTMNVAMKDCCIGRGLAAIRGKCCCNSFIEISLKKFAAVFARKNGDGTTFGAITKDELFGLPVIIPEKKILSSFGEIAIPLEKEITVEACKMSKLIPKSSGQRKNIQTGPLIPSELPQLLLKSPANWSKPCWTTKRRILRSTLLSPRQYKPPLPQSVSLKIIIWRKNNE